MSEALQDYRITIEEFRAFIEDRPDSEKWELIDGETVLNPAPNTGHQIVVSNLLFELETIRRRSDLRWHAIPGISVRDPGDQHNEPIPDVMIIPPSTDVFNWTYDALAIFEVLSPYSLRRDMVRKRRFYERIASLTNYVVLRQDRVEATVFARSDGFSGRTLKEPDEFIELAELEVRLAVIDLYRDVPVR